MYCYKCGQEIEENKIIKSNGVCTCPKCGTVINDENKMSRIEIKSKEKLGFFVCLTPMLLGLFSGIILYFVKVITGNSFAYVVIKIIGCTLLSLVISITGLIVGICKYPSGSIDRESFVDGWTKTISILSFVLFLVGSIVVLADWNLLS